MSASLRNSQKNERPLQTNYFEMQTWLDRFKCIREELEDLFSALMGFSEMTFRSHEMFLLNVSTVLHLIEMQQVNALKQDLCWSAYQGFVLPYRLAHGLEWNPALINNLGNNVTQGTEFFRAPSRYDWCHCKIISENVEGHGYHFHWQVKRGNWRICFASEWTNN